MFLEHGATTQSGGSGRFHRFASFSGHGPADKGCFVLGFPVPPHARLLLNAEAQRRRVRKVFCLSLPRRTLPDGAEFGTPKPCVLGGALAEPLHSSEFQCRARIDNSDELNPSANAPRFIWIVPRRPAPGGAGQPKTTPYAHSADGPKECEAPPSALPPLCVRSVLASCGTETRRRDGFGPSPVVRTHPPRASRFDPRNPKEFERRMGGQPGLSHWAGDKVWSHPS